MISYLTDLLDKIKKLLYKNPLFPVKIKIILERRFFKMKFHLKKAAKKDAESITRNHTFPLLHVEQIEKYYGNQGAVTKALNQISFDVQGGEFISIMGASGSGKTTLLNCISTIDTISSGHIFLDNKDITTINEDDIAAFRRDHLGFVFQDFHLLDTLTLEENIALPLTIRNLPPKEIHERVSHMAEQLQISEILKKFPTQVSGGQQQRCAFARAVICNPKLLLADEPTGSLDSHSSRILLEIISKFNQEAKVTILMVTHDAFSASYAKRILFLKDGQIFNEIRKGEKTRSTFYHEILDVLSLLGGDRLC